MLGCYIKEGTYCEDKLSWKMLIGHARRCKIGMLLRRETLSVVGKT